MRGISNCSQVHQRDTGSTNACNSLVLKPDNLVEAAGVEPASEKARRAKPTCVSGSI